MHERMLQSDAVYVRQRCNRSMEQESDRMSYIVPRDKPIACKHCGFMDRITYDCKLLGYKDYPDFATQYANCPLIEVPPHGRLIDADELKEDITEDAINLRMNGLKGTPRSTENHRWAIARLDEAKTIIEWSEE